MSDNKELCKWLRDNSSGCYRQSATGADTIEHLEAQLKELSNATLGRIATLELALSEISALTMDKHDQANYIAVEALNKDKG